MIEFYPQIKAVHVAMVLATITLFALRGIATFAGGHWPMSWPVRWVAYCIDTTLLTAGLMLLAILPWALFANGWLMAKLVLLVAYIVTGYLALRPGRPLATRVALYAAALVVFAAMYGIARAHHPLGLFRP